MNSILGLTRRATVIIAVAVVGAWSSSPVSAVDNRTGQVTCRVSLTEDDQQANSVSALPILSDSGRYVMFTSSATNLVAGDTNDTVDVFMRDRQRRDTIRISRTSTGAQANGPSYEEDLTPDGRYALFVSDATNLVPGDTNAASDIFVRDLRWGITERISVGDGGVQANYRSDDAAISPDGRYVAFASEAYNLVPDDHNWASDVFLHDRILGTTRLVSVSTAGEQTSSASGTPRISADGRLIVFGSLASDLVPEDTNTYQDVYLRDLVAGTTTLISVSPDGLPGNEYSVNPQISADGRYVSFYSFASNLVSGDTNGVGDIFVRDLVSGATERVSVSSTGAQGDEGAVSHAMSSDGRYVAFSSAATNLVVRDSNGVSDVFRHDRLTGTTELSSISTAGTQVTIRTGESRISISADGAQVAFTSEDSHLVPADTNGNDDVFVRSATGMPWVRKAC
jgi:hypothetical protein